MDAVNFQIVKSIFLPVVLNAEVIMNSPQRAKGIKAVKRDLNLRKDRRKKAPRWMARLKRALP